MSNEKLGSRLPIVVKADSVRVDLPGCTADHIRPAVEQAAAWPTPAFVVLGDGERRAKIPVQCAGFDGYELHIYAEVEQ